MKRKIISILLILALVACYIPIVNKTVRADVKPVKVVITPNRTNAEPGDQIIYTISLVVNEPVTNITLGLKVPDGLTYDERSAQLNEDFVNNISKGASEISVTERNYSYDYNAEEEDYATNGYSANEIYIVAFGTKNLNILPGKVTTGTVEIGTFSATVNTGASGVFTTIIDEVKTAFAKIGTEGKTENLFVSDIDVENGSVTVGTSGPETTPVDGVVVEEDGLSIDISTTATYQLHGHVTPDSATNQGLIWESNNEDVATVDENGLVTFVGEGSVGILAKSEENPVLFGICNIGVVCNHHGELDVHERVEPTCMAEGHEAYTICKVCGKYVVGAADQILGKVDHEYGELIPEDPGVHTETELRNGMRAHYECSVCHKLFNEDKVEVTEDQLVIVVNHTFDDEWYSDIDNHWHTCVGCGGIKDLAGHTGEPATCKNPAVCDICGRQYHDIDPDNHVHTEIRDAKDATCDEDGYTGDTYCTDCGEKIVEGTVIGKLGHTGGEATCSHKAVCTRCGEEYGELDPENHKNTETINAKDATCDEDGYTGDTYCNDCKQIVETGTVIGKLGHTGGEATCCHKAVCTRCGEEYGELNPDNHEGETELRDDVEATCTKDGYTGDTYCLGCGNLITEGSVINKLGHTGGEATCSHKAVCTRCGEEYGELDSDNHEGETELRDAKEATCIEKGYTGDLYCLGCGNLITEGSVIEIDPDNHVHTHVIPKVEPTTREPGTEEAIYCEDEGKIVSGGETIPVREPKINVEPEEDTKLDDSVVKAVKDLLLKISKGEAVGYINGDVDEIRERILDEDTDFVVDLIIDEISRDDIDKADLKLIDGVLTADSKAISYFDVILVLKANGEEIATINQVDSAISFLLSLPEEELPAVADGYERTFFVVRLHEYNDGVDKAERLGAAKEGTAVRTSSDKFSTFVLAYEDTKIPEEPVTPEEPAKDKPVGPNTGDNFNMTLWVSVLVISGIGFVVVSKCMPGKRSKH